MAEARVLFGGQGGSILYGGGSLLYGGGSLLYGGRGFPPSVETPNEYSVGVLLFVTFKVILIKFKMALIHGTRTTSCIQALKSYPQHCDSCD